MYWTLLLKCIRFQGKKIQQLHRQLKVKNELQNLVILIFLVSTVSKCVRTSDFLVVGKQILIYGRVKDIEIIDSFEFKLFKCQNNSKTNWRMVMVGMVRILPNKTIILSLLERSQLWNRRRSRDSSNYSQNILIKIVEWKIGRLPITP